MRFAILAFALVACREQKIADTPGAKPPTTCASTAAHMVDELVAGKDPRPPDEAVNRYIALIRTRCETDAWSVEAQNCLSAMQTAADADRCGTLLTPAQQEALVRDQAVEPAPDETVAPTDGAAPPPPPPPPAAPPAPEKRSAPAKGGPKPPEDPCAGGE